MMNTIPLFYHEAVTSSYYHPAMDYGCDPKGSSHQELLAGLRRNSAHAMPYNRPLRNTTIESVNVSEEVSTEEEKVKLSPVYLLYHAIESYLKNVKKISSSFK